MKQIFEYFRWIIVTSRPLLWLVHLSAFWFGAAQHPRFHFFSWSMWVLAFLTTVPFCVFIYAINDYYDLESDNHNQRKGGVFGPKNQDLKAHHLRIIGYVSGIITLLGWFILNWQVALVGLGLSVMLWAYSAPPVRFKAKPILDVITGGAGYLFALTIMGYLSVGTASVQKLIPFTPPLFIGFLGHWGAAAIDEEPDRIQGITTSAVVFGARQVIWICVLISLFGVSLFWQKPFMAGFFSFESVLLIAMLSKSFRLNVWVQRISGEYATYGMFLYVMMSCALNPSWLR